MLGAGVGVRVHRMHDSDLGWLEWAWSVMHDGPSLAPAGLSTSEGWLPTWGLGLCLLAQAFASWHGLFSASLAFERGD